MHQAINIYDSLSTNSNNLIADFKLSEIQFKALGDLDTAYQLYNKVYRFTKNKELKLNSILASHTGKTIKVLAHDPNRDNFMTSQKALEYGLIDQIVKTA